MERESDISKEISKISDEFARQIGQASDGLFIFVKVTSDIDFDADKLDWISDVCYESAIKANDLFHELLAITADLVNEMTGKKIFFGDVREYNNPHRDYFKMPGEKAEAE
ncbi:MAG: hypothetical protein HQK57_02260 [Deltaproteobacteria bacterium]|nr:hypothetical protein [Deltaproteobacteria bacterium]